MSKDAADYLDEWIICPECNRADVLDAFEVLGADEGNAFCPKCTAEISLTTAVSGDPVLCELGRLAEKYPGEVDAIDGIVRAYATKGQPQQAELF